MAASARALTPTHSGPFAASNIAPNTPTSIAPGGAVLGATLNPQATATSALRTSLSPKSPRLSPQPLSSAAAAAMADERRQREQKAREASRGQSPNPNAQAKDTLSGSDSAAAARPRDVPPAAPAQMTNPVDKVPKSIVIPENVTTDNIQTSPVSLSSFGSVENGAQTATSAEPTAAGALAIDNASGQDRSTPQAQTIAAQPGSAEGPANRAFTFPGPGALDADPRGPQRGMSLPMSGYGQGSPKSPNTKRHKCPYCATDFTRHHNLKSHLLTHSQEKPYECPDCHARFRRLHDLKRHTKLHTGERPHICPKCGRRFARGDALARHNKGQGGCAGRRSSFAGDDDMGDVSRDDTMDGLEYHGQDGDDSRMDEDQGDGVRRVAEPTRRGTNASTTSVSGSYHQHGSTYPPVAAAHGLGTNMRPIYPQNASGQSSGVFAQGGMTESPKPISPGQTDQHHRDNGSLPGGRSPNMSQHVLPQQYARGATKASSPMGFPPPPANSNAPQLPSLPGLAPADPRSAMSSRAPTGKGAPTAPNMLPHQVSGSNPGSLSSHGGSSGGSIRDIIGSRDMDVWSYVRDLEARTQRHNDQYEARIQQLEREVTSLRSQLGQQPPPQSSAPPPPPPPPPEQQQQQPQASR